MCTLANKYASRFFNFLAQVIMVRTADVTVSVSLPITLNSADHTEVRELETNKYAHNYFSYAIIL